MSAYDVHGTSVSKDGKEKQELRQVIRDELRSYLQDPLGFPEEFKGWLPEWITQVGIDLPISQVIGFSGFTFNVAPRVNTSEGTSSATYTNLTTVGPQLTGLPDGQYFIIFGCTAGSGAARDLSMSVKINATEAIDDDRLFLANTTTTLSNVSAISKTLAGGGNNTILSRYKTSSGAAVQVSQRWLAALKFANV